MSATMPMVDVSSLYQVADFVREHRVFLSLATLSAGFVYLTKKYYFCGGTCADTTTRLDGKTVIVTGANSGIGLETAREMARRGAHLILACRDPRRAQRAVKDIRQTTGNNDVHVGILDLASMRSIHAFAERILRQETRIDILINNAGKRFSSNNISSL